MTVTKNQVLRAAKLAKIHIPDEDVEVFTSRISKVFDWVEELQELDIANVKPLANPMEDREPHLMDCRPDNVTDGDCVKDILRNAPSVEYNMFKVPKVLD